MAIQVRIRRDTYTNLIAATPAAGEMAADLTNKRFALGDGLTLGGIPHSNVFDIQNNPWTAVTTSGTNTMTATVPFLAGYATYQRFQIKIGTTNTGASTINLNGLGAKTLKKRDNTGLIDVVAGDLISGLIYDIQYDGTYFQLLGGGGAGGNEVFLQRLTASNSAAIDFTLPSGYAYFRFDLRDVNCSSDQLTMRLNQGGGFITSGYAANGDRLTLASTLAGVDYTSLGTNAIFIGGGINGNGLRSTVWVYHTQTVSIRRGVVFDTWMPPGNIGGGNYQRARGVGNANANTDVTQVRFKLDSLNIPAGTFDMVGIKNA